MTKPAPAFGFYNMWNAALSKRRFKINLAFTLIFIATSLILLTSFLKYVEMRPGVNLKDPFLMLFHPVDVTWIIFIAIYSSLVISLTGLLKNPQLLLEGLQAYALMVIVRIAAMYLMPLNPPADMIPLADPFVQLFGPSQLLTKDLFFSGHTATLFLLFLFEHRPVYKKIILAALFIVAFSVILQHVHYTLDVFAAPFFTFCCYAIIKRLNLRTW